MKKLSLWARDHVWPARIIIVISSLLLAATGIATGLMLRDIQVTLPLICFVLFSLLYVAGLVLYPRKKNKKDGRVSYWRQKKCDLLLTGAGFLMIVYLGNHPQKMLNFSSSFAPVFAANSPLAKDSSFKTYKTIARFAASMKDENGKMLKWKERKKMLKEQVRAIKQSKEPSEGGKVALIVLSVIVALGLIALVGTLACSISCNGSGTLAVIVAIGGTALVIFLLVTVIRSILGKKKKNKGNPKEEPAGN